MKKLLASKRVSMLLVSVALFLGLWLVAHTGIMGAAMAGLFVYIMMPVPLNYAEIFEYKECPTCEGSGTVAKEEV